MRYYYELSNGIRIRSNTKLTFKKSGFNVEAEVTIIRIDDVEDEYPVKLFSVHKDNIICEWAA